MAEQGSEIKDYEEFKRKLKAYLVPITIEYHKCSKCGKDLAELFSKRHIKALSEGKKPYIVKNRVRCCDINQKCTTLHKGNKIYSIKKEIQWEEFEIEMLEAGIVRDEYRAVIKNFQYFVYDQIKNTGKINIPYCSKFDIIKNKYRSIMSNGKIGYYHYPREYNAIQRRPKFNKYLCLFDPFVRKILNSFSYEGIEIQANFLHKKEKADYNQSIVQKNKEKGICNTYQRMRLSISLQETQELMNQFWQMNQICFLGSEKQKDS